MRRKHQRVFCLSIYHCYYSKYKPYFIITIKDILARYRIRTKL